MRLSTEILAMALICRHAFSAPMCSKTFSEARNQSTPRLPVLKPRDAEYLSICEMARRGCQPPPWGKKCPGRSMSGTYSGGRWGWVHRSCATCASPRSSCWQPARVPLSGSPDLALRSPRSSRWSKPSDAHTYKLALRVDRCGGHFSGLAAHGGNPGCPRRFDRAAGGRISLAAFDHFLRDRGQSFDLWSHRPLCRRADRLVRGSPHDGCSSINRRDRCCIDPNDAAVLAAHSVMGRRGRRELRCHR